MENSSQRASPKSSTSDDKRKNSTRKYSNGFSTESTENSNKQKKTDSTEIDCVSSRGSVENKLICLKNEQSDKLNGTECAQSPRQNVRRKIVFNSSKEKNSVEQRSCFAEEHLETEIPRRKKLRSEVTEDELWEGFPQVVRFKRLTPQKSPIVKTLKETIYTNEDHSLVKKSDIPTESGKCVSVDKSKSKTKQDEITKIKPRTVFNIFKDFSKVVHEDNKLSPDSQGETKRKAKSRTCEVNTVLTPKRSARLQEKRDSPSVQKPSDFVYPSTKNDYSKEKVRYGTNTLTGENVLSDIVKDQGDNIGQINSALSDNEAAKQLYKRTILRDFKNNWCGISINSLSRNTENEDETVVSENLKQTVFENTRQHVQISCHGNRPKKMITSPNRPAAMSDKKEIFREQIVSNSLNYETESAICDLMAQLISKVEINDTTGGERKSAQPNKSPSTLNIEAILEETETKKTNKKDGIPIEMSFKTEPFFYPTEKNKLNENNFADSKMTFDNQTKPNFDENTAVNSAQLSSTLKMRIRRHEDGAQIIYSDTKDDHAYVLCRPKGKHGKKNSKGNSSSNVKSNRKRSLQKDEGSVKRRSPRVANASSVGKGPGMVESPAIVKDENESSQKPADSYKSIRIDKPKKKQASDEEQLLKNNRVGKYACILWSSDQRRHYQQLNPDASVQEVDSLMRKAWEDLESKDKLRYFVRASHAIRDENKHSNAKRLTTDTEEDEKQPCPAMKIFLSLSPKEQDEQLKRWLKFFYEVSPSEYAKLKTLEKPKMKKDQPKLKTNKEDPLQYYRQVLYQSILDSKDKIKELYERKKQKQQDILKDAFGTTIKRLITGSSSEELKLSRDVVSKKLAEVLLDLQHLENERKVGVSGSPLSSKSYERLVNNLKANDSKDSPYSLEADDEGENEFSQDLLEKITEDDLPLLEIQSVDDALQSSDENEDNHLFSSEILEQLSAIFEQQAKREVYKNEENMENMEINNPSNILNNWVLADQLRAMARDVSRGYHGPSMYSLLDRKNWLRFLKDRNYLNNRYNCYSNLHRPNFSNNSAEPKTEYYQDKIDRLNNQPQLQACPAIRMVEPSGIHAPQKIRPTLSVTSPQSLIRRPSPGGHTFVKFTSQPLGRCRVFSVRQTK